jgi:hypothetical protein
VRAADDPELRILRALAGTREGQEAIRREMRKRKLRLVWLPARRVWLQLWNAPRAAVESPEADARSFLVAQIVLYILTAVMLAAGLVRVLR